MEDEFESRCPRCGAVDSFEGIGGPWFECMVCLYKPHRDPDSPSYEGDDEDDEDE